MALPTTISGVAATVDDGPAFYGPFVSGGNVYVVAPSSAGTGLLGAWKATDPTSSFTEQDTSNRPSLGNPTNSIWVYQVGTLLHIAVYVSTPNLQYCRFDMSSDSWVSFLGDTSPLIDAAITNPLIQACSIVARSDGSMVAAYNGDSDLYHGGDYARVDVAYSSDGSSWTDSVDATNDTGSPVQYRNPICVLGASDRVHIFYRNTSSNAMKVSTWLSTNTWGSRNITVDEPGFAPMAGRGVNVSGTIYVPYRGSSSSATSVANFTSADTPGSFTITSGVSGVAPKIVTDFALHGLSLDGTDRHLGYIRASDDDFARDVDTGSGWGTDTVELTLASVTHLSSNVIDR